MNNNNKKKTLRRRFVTLIEMMIVMFLIALITGVVAYNYRGSLEEGKAFKTKTAIDKLSTILSLAIAENSEEDLSGGGWKDFIKRSPLVQDPDALIKDGWGHEYRVEYDGANHTVVITSDSYNQYLQKKNGR